MTLLLGLAAQVAMTVPAPLARGLAAFPRIAAPVTRPARRINAAVMRLDQRARRAARDCRADSVNPTSWDRTVEATMRGPVFLSFLVTDDFDCGGAHPSESHGAIVYDLATGAPVDWIVLLGGRLAGTLALTQGADGVSVVTLDSPRLRALYAARYDAAARAVGAPADCLGDATMEGFVQPMLAWLDARAQAMIVQFDLNHVMQACSVPVVIPVAVLQREGASARLVAALRGTPR